MKITHFAAAVIFALSLSNASPSLAQEHDAKFAAAYEAGKQEAVEDVRAGKLVCRAFGLPAPWDQFRAHLLRRDYGIVVERVAGCMVSDELIERTRGYNEVSLAAIRAQFGQDVLRDAEERAREGFREREREVEAASADRVREAQKLYAGPVVELGGLRLNGRALDYGAEFDAEDGWFAGLSVEVKNTSPKEIRVLRMEILFPLEDPELRVMTIDVSNGVQVGSDGAVSGGQPIRPGEAVTLFVGREALGGVRARHGRAAGARVTRWEGPRLQATYVRFDDDTQWAAGAISVRNPLEEGGWIAVPRP